MVGMVGGLEWLEGWSSWRALTVVIGLLVGGTFYKAIVKCIFGGVQMTTFVLPNFVYENR